jgi:hypothetical protein
MASLKILYDTMDGAKKVFFSAGKNEQLYRCV